MASPSGSSTEAQTKLWDIAEDDDNAIAASANNPLTRSNFCNTYCHRNNAIKVTKLILSLGVFSVTTYFTIESLVTKNPEQRKVTKLYVCALVNGASVAAFFHMVIPTKPKKKINEFVRAWSYELLFTLSQVYLNLAPSDQMKVLATPFVWWLGLSQAKGLFNILSIKKSEFSLSTTPPEENELISTLGFTTRNHSVRAKIWLGALAVSAIGLTALNFSFINKNESLGDLGKLGIPQDIIAIFSGSVAGEIMARIFKHWKEKSERKYTTALLQQRMPTSLRIARTAESIFVLSSPIVTGVLLSIPNHPNTPADYAIKGTIGVILGKNFVLAKSEFENPKSYFHTLDSNQTTEIIPLAEKVQAIAKKHVPSIVFFGAVTGFLSWAAITSDTSPITAAISTFLITTLLSYLFTNGIASRYHPVENRQNRFSNELHFRFVFFAMAFSIFYQYLTEKLDIGDNALNTTNSNVLLSLMIISWGILGLTAGNNRAINIQTRKAYASPVDPPILTQELGKTFVHNLIKS